MEGGRVMVFFAFWLMVIVIIYLVFLIIEEKLKNKHRRDNMMLGIEVSIIALSLIAINAPNTEYNFALFMEWTGIGLLFMGIFIFGRFYRIKD